jgi:hypothetical protein
MRTQQQDAPGRAMTVNVATASTGVSFNPGVTVTKTATGAYTVKVSGLRAILSAIGSINTGGFVAVAISAQPDTLAVNTWNSAAVATDIAFNLIIAGFAR